MRDANAGACGTLERAGVVEYDACMEALKPPPADPVTTLVFILACVAAIGILLFFGVVVDQRRARARQP